MKGKFQSVAGSRLHKHFIELSCFTKIDRIPLCWHNMRPQYAPSKETVEKVETNNSGNRQLTRKIPSL